MANDHYEQRLYAAKLVAHVCKKYGPVYQTLSPRTTKTLLRALLDISKPLSTVYGALAGLRELVGVEGVNLLVVPNVKALHSRISQGKLEEDKMDAEKVEELLLQTLTDHYQAQLEHTTTTDSRKGAVRELNDKLRPSYGSYAHQIFNKQ